MTIYAQGTNQHKTKVKNEWHVYALVTAITVFVVGSSIFAKPSMKDQTTEYLKQFTFGKFAPLAVAAQPTLMEKKEAGTSAVPKGVKTEIYEYLIEKFGDHASDAIAIIRTCENSSFEPTRMSGLNKNGTVDVGVMQISVDANNKAEIELLKDYKYNIDRGYAKWLAGDGGKHKKSFYLWTCAKVINQYNYVDAMNGK